jgi:hypothetical protein
MKSTKIMLAIIACLLTTWTSMSLIGYAVSELSLRECYTDGATLMLMLIFGWIPSVIIACDLDKHLNNNKHERF